MMNHSFATTTGWFYSKRLRRICELSSMPTLLLTADNNQIRSVCTLFSERFGWSQEQLLGSRLEPLICSGYEPLQHWITHPHPTENREQSSTAIFGSDHSCRLRSADGTEQPVEIALIPLTLEERRSILMIFHDLETPPVWHHFATSLLGKIVLPLESQPFVQLARDQQAPLPIGLTPPPPLAIGATRPH